MRPLVKQTTRVTLYVHVSQAWHTYHYFDLFRIVIHLFFSGGDPHNHAVDAQKIPVNKHELYQFLEDGEFNFHGAQNYTSEVLFAGSNIGGANFETEVSEFR